MTKRHEYRDSIDYRCEQFDELISKSKYEDAHELLFEALNIGFTLCEYAGEAEDYERVLDMYYKAIDLCRYDFDYINSDIQAIFDDSLKLAQYLFNQTSNQDYLKTKDDIIRLYSEIRSLQISFKKESAFSDKYKSLYENAKVLGSYDVLTNDDNEVLISMKSVTDKPENTEDIDATMFYDGKQHAILIKNGNTAIVCDYLHDGVRDIMYSNDEILICEMRDGEISLEYMARLVKEEGIEDLVDQILSKNK